MTLFRGYNLPLFFSILLMAACIGDDIVLDEVEPTVRITNAADTLAINTQFLFEHAFFDNVGKQVTNDAIVWSSSNPAVVSIEASGLATAIQLGAATITVEATQDGSVYQDWHDIVIGQNTVLSETSRKGTIQTTSSYQLTGSFTLTQTDSDLYLSFDDDYAATSALPGLVVYLTNNPETIDNALEIAAVSVFSGSHGYQISNVDINDYSHVLYFCKPFRVKVGDGEIED